MVKALFLIGGNLSQINQFKQHFGQLDYTVLSVPVGTAGLDLLTAQMNTGQLFKSLVVVVIDNDESFSSDEQSVNVCRQLRQRAAIRFLPILYYTKSSNPKKMLAAYEAGADFYSIEGEESFIALELLIELMHKWRRDKRGIVYPLRKPLSSSQYPLLSPVSAKALKAAS